MKRLLTSLAAISAVATGTVAQPAFAKTEDANPYAVQTIGSLRGFDETVRQYYIGGVVQATAFVDGSLKERDDVAACIAGSGVMIDQMVGQAADFLLDEKITDLVNQFSDACEDDPSSFNGRAMTAEADGEAMFGQNTNAQHRAYFLLGAIDLTSERIGSNLGQEKGQCIRDVTESLLNPGSEDSKWLMEESEGPIFSALIVVSSDICDSEDPAPKTHS